MIIFRSALVLMGACLFSLLVGFSLGQDTFVATNQGVQFETSHMQVTVIFKPAAASDLSKRLGAVSLHFYTKVLTVCLSEREDVEKIKSANILNDYIAASRLVNAFRSRVDDPEKKGEEKKPEQNSFDGKYIL